MSVFRELKRREAAGMPVRIAVVGTGWLGGGLLRRIAAIPGMVAVVAANRTVERAVAALQAAGIERSAIRVCQELGEAQTALNEGCSVATPSLLLPAHLTNVDVVMEATGDVLVGAAVAHEALLEGKHVVAANPETQATVGALLRRVADENGVVYSDIDGDEPGMLKKLYDYFAGLGLEPVVAGNFKGVLKRYASPETQAAFAEANGLKPWIVTAAADGTKLNLELTVVANATGLLPPVRGMVGPQTTLDTLVEDFERLGLLEGERIVDYALGNMSGVFVVVRSDDPAVRRDFRYLKLGDGPHYLLYRPRVLVHYEAPLSAAEAALYGAATVSPSGSPVAEVGTFAKRDLHVGERLDGIGGYHCYGLIVRADEAHGEGMVPIGLSGYARLARDVAKDEPITYDAIEWDEENLAVELRRRQDALFSA